MPPIILDSISKTYPNGTLAVDGISLSVADGKLTVLVGPSGCGKSTLLRMVAGLERASAGRILFGEQDVTRLTAAERDIAMVFQNYALYPQMTVAQNIGFSLRLRRRPRAEIAQRVHEAAEILELTQLLDRKPAELSGGQRQRVAMGRAITRRPQAFLLDEPLSNLDARLRDQMRREIRLIQRRVGASSLYVTHDQVEAMTLGDEVAVMRAGRIEQLAPPIELYARPANMFVASFIGSPPMNLMRCRVEQEAAGAVRLRLGAQTLALPAELAHLPGLAGRTEIVLGIRPEDVVEPGASQADASDPSLDVTIAGREDFGSSSLLYAELDAPPIHGNRIADRLEGAAPAALARAGAATTRFVAEVAPNSPLRAGDGTSLRLPASALHVFDLDSGARLTAEPLPALVAR